MFATSKLINCKIDEEHCNLEFDCGKTVRAHQGLEEVTQYIKDHATFCDDCTEVVVEYYSAIKISRKEIIDVPGEQQRLPALVA